MIVKDKVFGHLEPGTLDPISSIMKLYFADPDPAKVNLSAGVYADENGKPVVFSAVLKAEELIMKDPTRSKSYLPWTGLPSFNQTAQNILFGDSCEAIKSGRVATLQSISGTGALASGLTLLAQSVPGTVYVPQPTWASHPGMIAHHRMPMREYPYWDPVIKGLNFEKLTTHLARCPAGSIIILHAGAHNPTGSDLTDEQWQDLSKLCLDRRLIPFFDLAYQGFASGDMDKDAYAIRLFTEHGHNLLVAQSFSKNFGLYGERIGALHVVCRDSSTVKTVISHLENIAVMTYLNPPQHGALIVDTIWRNPALRQEHLADVAAVVRRISSIREALRNELERLKVPGDWSHITSQRGMFSYTGLTAAQCEALAAEHHIYIVANGRINMAGVNGKNVGMIAKAIHAVVVGKTTN
jgi:aspartate aminotransferase, cytoplasmic